MEIRYSCNQKDFKRYTTEEMRDEMLITGRDLHIVRPETMFNINPQFAFGQIPNMSHGSYHIIAFPKIFLDCLCLCGGLHNYKF